MRKIYIAAIAAIATLGAFNVSADDVIVRTSVGSGEVVFTETDEAADITSAELSELMEKYLNDTEKMKNMNIFIDAAADASVNFGTEMDIKADAIGTIDKNGDTSHARLHYSYNGLSDDYEAYMWKEGNKNYTAVESDGEWLVDSSFDVSDIINDFKSDHAEKAELDGMLPNVYEEDGKKFYVCVYDKNNIADSMDKFEVPDEYRKIVDGIIGDNNMRFVIVINADTGMLRAVTLDASDSKGTIPGDMFEMDEDVTFECKDLYATMLFDEQAEEVMIPSEALDAAEAGAGEESFSEDLLTDFENAFSVEEIPE